MTDNTKDINDVFNTILLAEERYGIDIYCSLNIL